MTEPPRTAHDLLLERFPTWQAKASRGDAGTMEARRSSCPRLPVREDEAGEGLVRVEATGAPGMRACRVALTPQGRVRLAAARPATDPAAARRRAA